LDSATKARALDLSAPRPKATTTEIFLPSMTVNDIDLLNGAPMTGWRVLIGIDGLIGINGQAPERRRLLLAITGDAEGVDRGRRNEPTDGAGQPDHPIKVPPNSITNSSAITWRAKHQSR
jgi:hypothetical protein